MKRKIYVPIMNGTINDNNKQHYVKSLREIGASNVFIAVERKFQLCSDRQEFLKKLECNIRYFEKNDFETGVWMQAFGFGGPLTKEQNSYTEKYKKLKSVCGVKAQGDALCPTNDDFVNDYCDCVKQIAKLGPKLIMLDDDLCMSVRPGLGCFCDKHIQMLNNEIGENLSLSEWKNRIFTGEKNHYRSAYIKVMGDTLRSFCKKVRESLDTVNPDIRMGLCAGYTSWDIEGVDTVELSKILSGNTKPFFRFTGAPYWVAKDVTRFYGQRLGTVIECVRSQEMWCSDEDVDIFSEADSYPRPRFHVPASYIECFDIALSAHSGMDVLKYVCDYFSEPQYETGYIKNHVRNAGLYDFVQSHFSNKINSGVQVYDEQKKLENATFDNEFCGEDKIMNMFFSKAASMLSSLCIPTTYENNNKYAIAFGENAKYVKHFPQKLIIDAKAAKIFSQKGIDVGITSFEPADVPVIEKCDENKICMTIVSGNYYNCGYAKTTSVLSLFEDAQGHEYPAVMKYKNEKLNTEFFIISVDAESENDCCTVFRSYLRQSQILNFINDFPYIMNQPDVYQIFKTNEKESAILFENLSEDTIFDFVIQLDKKYSKMEICGASGILIGDKIKITSDFSPYRAIAVNLIV